MRINPLLIEGLQVERTDLHTSSSKIAQLVSESKSSIVHLTYDPTTKTNISFTENVANSFFSIN